MTAKHIAKYTNAMDIFTYSDYKPFLIIMIKSKPRGYQAALAKALECQAAYLIQVLNKKGDLTGDQALKATEFLNLSDEARDFFMLLVNFSRASTKALREYYKEKIFQQRRNHEQLKNRVPPAKEIELKISMEYFSNWDVSTIHIATSSQAFQEPEIIAERFRMSLERVHYVLQFLEKNNLVERNGKKWVFKGDPIYLAKESALHNIHQINRREQVARSLREHDHEDIHFATVFAISKAHFNELKSDVKSLIEKAHQKIVKSPSEEVCSLVIDLFKVV